MQYDVIWCEDCEYFSNVDMGGNGWCDTYEKATWYGCNAIDCRYFERKEPSKEETE